MVHQMTHLVSKFITQAAETELSIERILTAGSNISITDGGAGAALTIAAIQHNYEAVTNGDPASPEFVFVDGDIVTVEVV
jgi:hypothetical protein